MAAQIVDRADHRRKAHHRPLPRSGGLAILAAYFAAFAVASPSTALRWAPGAAIVFLTGLADDRWDLRPRHKLLAEFAGAACLYAAGARIEIGFLPAWFGIGATLAWLILCANAFNLIDGSDGVAVGVSAAAALSLVAAAVIDGNGPLLAAAAPLAGALLGFLRYNVHPATLFIGDCGSLTVGLMLGACATIGSAGQPQALPGFAISALPLAVPLLDVCLSVARRLLRNRHICEADRGHIHHRLLDRGLTPRAVALALSAATVFCGALAAAAGVAPIPVAIAFGGAVWAGVRCLGYSEFRAAARFVRQDLRRLVAGRVIIEELETAVRSARDVEDCWRALAVAAEALGYDRIAARLGGRRFVWGPHGRSAWQTRVTLPDGDYVEAAQFAGSAVPQAHGPFIASVRDVLPPAIAAARCAAPLRHDEAPAERRWTRQTAEVTAASGD